MRCAYLSLAFGLILLGDAFAQAYKPPKFDKPAFDVKKVGLMEVERQKFATNLAGYVANEVKVAENSHKAEWARKLIGLALHLDRRNRVALVANHQFNRGLAPKKVAMDYKTEPLAKLLIAKSKAIAAVGGQENLYLAGLFLATAVEMDPGNEDAVYQMELYKIDVGQIDWEPITDGKPRKPLKDPKPDGIARDK